jgi:2-isopropylmalate synthase
VLTARSGRSALAYRFKLLGFEFDRNDVDVLYQQFLEVADSKKEVENKDLTEMALAYQQKNSTITSV